MKTIFTILALLSVVGFTSCSDSVSPKLNLDFNMDCNGSYPEVHLSMYPKCDSFKANWIVLHNGSEYQFNSVYKIGTLTSGLYQYNLYEKSDTGNIVVKPLFDINIPFTSKSFFPFFTEQSFQLDANNTPGFSKEYNIKYGGSVTSTISRMDSVEYFDKYGSRSMCITNREVQVHLVMTDQTQKDTITIDGKFSLVTNPNY
ncbi:MAG: hypothetical protein U0Y96_12735 [Candidatus Kapaibacterium sp.]